MSASFDAPAPPAISIGMPVFNGEALLDDAIASILSQDFTDFELIISDNASTDRTEAIVRSYAAADARIRYLRQPVNRGALANFALVLAEACGEFFLWAAIDDTRSSDFLRVNRDQLVHHPDCVGSTSPTRFEDAPADPRKNGDGLLGGPDLAIRITDFLSTAHANSAFYSLFRRTALSRAMSPLTWYLGFDWTVMLRLAVVGPLARVDDGWCRRGSKGLSTDIGAILRSNRGRRINWLLPFYDFSLEAMKCARALSVAQRLKIAILLIRLNYRAFRAQLAFSLGRYRSRQPDA